MIFAVEAASVIAGAKPVFITDDDGKTGHAMIQLPDSRLFDVRGLFAPGTLREHCPAETPGGIVHLGRNAAGRIVHEEMGLPEPVMVPLAATTHGREHEQAGWTDKTFARLAAERIWKECQ